MSDKSTTIAPPPAGTPPEPEYVQLDEQGNPLPMPPLAFLPAYMEKNELPQPAPVANTTDARVDFPAVVLAEFQFRQELPDGRVLWSNFPVTQRANSIAEALEAIQEAAIYANHRWGLHLVKCAPAVPAPATTVNFAGQAPIPPSKAAPPTSATSPAPKGAVASDQFLADEVEIDKPNDKGYCKIKFFASGAKGYFVSASWKPDYALGKMSKLGVFTPAHFQQGTSRFPLPCIVTYTTKPSQFGDKPWLAAEDVAVR